MRTSGSTWDVNVATEADEKPFIFSSSDKFIKVGVVAYGSFTLSECVREGRFLIGPYKIQCLIQCAKKPQNKSLLLSFSVNASLDGNLFDMLALYVDIQLRTTRLLMIWFIA